jgi:uncharacterized protein
MDDHNNNALLLTKDEFDRVREFAYAGSDMPDSELHGDMHWRAVAAQGLRISELCNMGQRGRTTAALFGLFHDCRRENDGKDPQHGPRGADALIECQSLIEVDPLLMETLAESMIYHDCGTTTFDPMIGLGWDADRSLLTRVGIVPQYHYFSTLPAERFEDFILAGYEQTEKPPSWDHIYSMAFATA